LPTGASGSTQVDGPVQVQNRFQSDPRVAQDRTLFNNPNVTVTYGNLITLPVANGFLYVEPVYIRQRNQLSYPQLARVLVSYGTKIGFAPTLNEALDQVFGAGTGSGVTPPQTGGTPGPTTPPPPGTSTPQPPAGGNPALDKAAGDMHDAWVKFRAAQQSGNYADQGAALAALEAASKAYESAKAAPPASGAPPTSGQPGG
ncbi:membrane protein, partial [Amycolatopsis lurida]